MTPANGQLQSATIPAQLLLQMLSNVTRTGIACIGGLTYVLLTYLCQIGHCPVSSFMQCMMLYFWKQSLTHPMCVRSLAACPCNSSTSAAPVPLVLAPSDSSLLTVSAPEESVKSWFNEPCNLAVSDGPSG